MEERTKMKEHSHDPRKLCWDQNYQMLLDLQSSAYTWSARDPLHLIQNSLQEGKLKPPETQAALWIW